MSLKDGVEAAKQGASAVGNAVSDVASRAYEAEIPKEFFQGLLLVVLKVVGFLAAIYACALSGHLAAGIFHALLSKPILLHFYSTFPRKYPHSKRGDEAFTIAKEDLLSRLERPIRIVSSAGFLFGFFCSATFIYRLFF